MRAVFIMLDSVNRRFLNCYHAKEAAITPNIDRLAEQGVVFENHWVGSSPCMPARRDMMTGRLNFLECPWGGIWPCEDTLPRVLRENRIFTHMETDHFHYEEMGGENYMNQFTSWHMNRGTDPDTIYLRPCREGIPDNFHARCQEEDWLGIYSRAYSEVRKFYDGKKENFSTARTFDRAAQWLEESKDADQFLLWVEGFDPHEPFDVPQEFLELYRDCCEFDEKFFWPPYDVTDGYSEKQITQIRYRYQALLTMTDYYIGRVLDVLDKNDMWKDTAVIFTTDHGYLLGEHGFFAKNYMPDYNELMHIPMIMWHPGCKSGRVQALTQNIDLLPTVMELFGIPEEQLHNRIHGKSVLPLMDGRKSSNREYALFGQFGKNVNITDGRHVYMRAPGTRENLPLNLYTVMPYILGESIGLDMMDAKDFGKIEAARLSWTDYPVWKYPASIVVCDTTQGFNGCLPYAQKSMLFDIVEDYEQEHPIQNKEMEQMWCENLKKTMAIFDAPPEQLERLGI
jgi:arylsulfatase A-like enzyme